jgi:hypothetical protein
MKIALHNELPAPAQIQQLINSMSDTEFSTDASSYDTYMQSPKVIAAYDQERLVAIGRLVVSSDTPELEVTVLPSYRGREIEEHMRKLLHIRSVKM